MKHIATCNCGQLQLTYEGELPASSVCHCNSCQKRTGSVFGVQARIKRADVQLTGEDKSWEFTSDEGNPVTFHFCGTCGSTLYWELHGMPSDFVVAVGSFADSSFPAPTFSVYEARQHPWVALPDSVTTHWD